MNRIKYFIVGKSGPMDSCGEVRKTEMQRNALSFFCYRASGLPDFRTLDYCNATFGI